MQPFVSVIVVNYNGRTWLDACLRSLERQSYPRDRYEVLFVDNGSRDDSVAFVRTNFPGVIVIEARANLGFAAGNNRGFALARGEWVALLNCDASAAFDWLAEMVRAGHVLPRIGGVASQMTFRDRPQVVNGTGIELYSDGRAGDRDFDQPKKSVTRPAGPVFGACGAAALYRRAMLDELSGFDPSLFMYYEDLDLAWRARRRGWQFVYAPGARVSHAFGASAGVASPFQVYCVERNRARVNMLHSVLWLAVASYLGLAARCARCVCRWVTASTSAGHVRAHLAAAGSALANLPRDAGRRWWWRTHFGDSTRLFRRWSRPAPG